MENHPVTTIGLQCGTTVRVRHSIKDVHDAFDRAQGGRWTTAYFQTDDTLSAQIAIPVSAVSYFRSDGGPPAHDAPA